MTSAGPWSVKGIDPRAREIAKDLARRSGMTLGEWLNQMITEGVEAAEPVPATPSRPAASVSTAALAAAATSTGSGATAPLVAAAADRGRRAAAEALVSPHEANRISAALDTLTARLEEVESRSTAAINHVDRAVRTALSRLDVGERENGVILGKVETALNMIRAEQRRADDRVGRLERDGAGRLEALRSLEIAVSRLQPPDTDKIAEAATARMAKRLADAEARTRASMNELSTSLAGLDQRLAASEDRASRESEALSRTEHQLQTLAAELNAQVDRARTELTARLTESLEAAASSNRLETLELAINQLAGQVDQTEQVSAQAIDRMGREVMKIADAISERVSTVEQRTAGVTDQLTQEVGKIVDVMDKRLQRTEQTHTAALHKLSSDISKVAERLTDRIARHEGLTAEAVEGLKAQIGGSASAEVSQELSDRIRQSEERTARLLEDAQARFNARAEVAPPVPQAEAPLAAEAPETHPAAPPATPSTTPAAHDPWDIDGGDDFVAPAFGSLAETPAPEPDHASDYAPHHESDDAADHAALAPRSQALSDPAPALHAPLPPEETLDPFEALGPELGEPFDADVFAGEIARVTLPAERPRIRGDEEEPRRSSLVNRDALDALRAAEPLAAIVEPADHAPVPPRHGEATADAAVLAMFENLDFGDDHGPSAPGSHAVGDDHLFEPRAPEATDLDPSDPFVSHAFDDLDPPGHGAADDGLFAEAEGHGFGGRAAQPRAHDSFFSDEPAFAPLSTPSHSDDMVPFGHHAAPAAEADADDPFSVPEAEAEVEQRPLTTRELIAQARNAARAASGSVGGGSVSPAADPAPERGLFKGKGFGGKAKAAPGGDTSGKAARGPFGLALPKRKRKDDGVSTVTLLLATAVSLTVTATVLGFMIVNDGSKDEGHGTPLVARSGSPAAPALSGDATAGAPSTQANELAVATTPGPAAAASATLGPTDEGKALYATAVAQLQARDDAKAFSTLVRAAAAGYPAAQFHLSKIYERGGAGQSPDLAKARMWAERAAKAGVAEAMFNLGLFMYEGQGGPPDLPGAADWFTRAAKLGLKDAQYNLARLYENGYGVTQNFSLAYQWYLVAADVSGDKEAHADADRLRPTLTAEGRKAAERFAETFRPEPAVAYASAPTTGRLAQSR